MPSTTQSLLRSTAGSARSTKPRKPMRDVGELIGDWQVWRKIFETTSQQTYPNIPNMIQGKNKIWMSLKISCTPYCQLKLYSLNLCVEPNLSPGPRSHSPCIPAVATSPSRNSWHARWSSKVWPSTGHHWLWPYLVVFYKHVADEHHHNFGKTAEHCEAKCFTHRLTCKIIEMFEHALIQRPPGPFQRDAFHLCTGERQFGHEEATKCTELAKTGK